MEDDKHVTITEIAKELKLDLKVARARLRRAGKDVPKTASAESWSWAKSQVPAVKALLKA
jgi:hypothetical protein